MSLLPSRFRIGDGGSGGPESPSVAAYPALSPSSLASRKKSVIGAGFGVGAGAGGVAPTSPRAPLSPRSPQQQNSVRYLSSSDDAHADTDPTIIRKQGSKQYHHQPVISPAAGIWRQKQLKQRLNVSVGADEIAVGGATGGHEAGICLSPRKINARDLAGGGSLLREDQHLTSNQRQPTSLSSAVRSGLKMGNEIKSMDYATFEEEDETEPRDGPEEESITTENDTDDADDNNEEEEEVQVQQEPEESVATETLSSAQLRKDHADDTTTGEVSTLMVSLDDVKAHNTSDELLVEEEEAAAVSPKKKSSPSPKKKRKGGKSKKGNKKKKGGNNKSKKVTRPTSVLDEAEAPTDEEEGAYWGISKNHSGFSSVTGASLLSHGDEQDDYEDDSDSSNESLVGDDDGEQVGAKKAISTKNLKTAAANPKATTVASPPKAALTPKKGTSTPISSQAALRLSLWRDRDTLVVSESSPSKSRAATAATAAADVIVSRHNRAGGPESIHQRPPQLLLPSLCSKSVKTNEIDSVVEQATSTVSSIMERGTATPRGKKPPFSFASNRLPPSTPTPRSATTGVKKELSFTQVRTAMRKFLSSSARKHGASADQSKKEASPTELQAAFWSKCAVLTATAVMATGKAANNRVQLAQAAAETVLANCPKAEDGAYQAADDSEDWRIAAADKLETIAADVSAAIMSVGSKGGRQASAAAAASAAAIVILNQNDSLLPPVEELEVATTTEEAATEDIQEANDAKALDTVDYPSPKKSIRGTLNTVGVLLNMPIEEDSVAEESVMPAKEDSAANASSPLDSTKDDVREVDGKAAELGSTDDDASDEDASDEGPSLKKSIKGTLDTVGALLSMAQAELAETPVPSLDEGSDASDNLEMEAEAGAQARALPEAIEQAADGEESPKASGAVMAAAAVAKGAGAAALCTSATEENEARNIPVDAPVDASVAEDAPSDNLEVVAVVGVEQTEPIPGEKAADEDNILQQEHISTSPVASRGITESGTLTRQLIQSSNSLDTVDNENDVEENDDSEHALALATVAAVGATTAAVLCKSVKEGEQLTEPNAEEAPIDKIVGESTADVETEVVSSEAKHTEESLVTDETSTANFAADKALANEELTLKPVAVETLADDQVASTPPSEEIEDQDEQTELQTTKEDALVEKAMSNKTNELNIDTTDSQMLDEAAAIILATPKEQEAEEDDEDNILEQEHISTSPVASSSIKESCAVTKHLIQSNDSLSDDEDDTTSIEEVIEEEEEASLDIPATVEKSKNKEWLENLDTKRKERDAKVDKVRDFEAYLAKIHVTEEGEDSAIEIHYDTRDEAVTTDAFSPKNLAEMKNLDFMSVVERRRQEIEMEKSAPTKEPEVGNNLAHRVKDIRPRAVGEGSKKEEAKQNFDEDEDNNSLSREDSIDEISSKEEATMSKAVETDNDIDTAPEEQQAGSEEEEEIPTPPVAFRSIKESSAVTRQFIQSASPTGSSNIKESSAVTRQLIHSNDSLSDDEDKLQDEDKEKDLAKSVSFKEGPPDVQTITPIGSDETPVPSTVVAEEDRETPDDGLSKSESKVHVETSDSVLTDATDNPTEHVEVLLDKEREKTVTVVPKSKARKDGVEVDDEEEEEDEEKEEPNIEILLDEDRRKAFTKETAPKIDAENDEANASGIPTTTSDMLSAKLRKSLAQSAATVSDTMPLYEESEASNNTEAAAESEIEADKENDSTENVSAEPVDASVKDKKVLAELEVEAKTVDAMGKDGDVTAKEDVAGNSEVEEIKAGEPAQLSSASAAAIKAEYMTAMGIGKKKTKKSFSVKKFFKKKKK